MTKFDKAQFSTGVYLTYGPDRKFVARFKYTRRDRARFISFLTKNFCVEEYFAMLDAGATPVAAMETKGYISLTVSLILKDAGYPVTQEGFAAYVKAQAAARADAALAQRVFGGTFDMRGNRVNAGEWITNKIEQGL